jgi:outer membrane lipoprotein SlyB
MSAAHDTKDPTAFLRSCHAETADIYDRAVRYASEPVMALGQFRTFGEYFTDLVGRRAGVARAVKPGSTNLEDLADYAKRLRASGHLGAEQLDWLDDVRKTGNRAVHENRGGAHDVTRVLGKSRQLIAWFELLQRPASVAPAPPKTPPPTPSPDLSHANVHVLPIANSQRSAVQGRRKTDGRPIAAALFVAVLILLVVGGGYAFVRMGGLGQSSRPQVAIETFATPKTYQVTPAGRLRSANERAAPGVESPKLASLARGSLVVGVGLARDVQGIEWIALNDGRYVKASLLTEQRDAAAAPVATEPAPAPAASEEAANAPAPAPTSQISAPQEQPAPLDPVDRREIVLVQAVREIRAQPNAGGSTATGAAVGALAGSQFGRHSNARATGALLGALLGGAVGHEAAGPGPVIGFLYSLQRASDGAMFEVSLPADQAFAPGTRLELIRNGNRAYFRPAD